ncbi:MAG: Hsp20/alpha crystallin family protein [Cyclobacteriaceae bacterium]|jgi:HSP20 family protein
MTLIKYNPYVRNRYPGSFVNLFDKFFYDRLEDSSADRFLPSANILETEKAYEVQLAVPGMKKEDFNIDLEDGKLFISGERHFENGEGTTLHQNEIHQGSFKRVFHLPEDADQKKISANYENGILYIEVVKDVKKVLKQKISVK